MKTEDDNWRCNGCGRQYIDYPGEQCGFCSGEFVEIE